MTLSAFPVALDSRSTTLGYSRTAGDHLGLDLLRLGLDLLRRSHLRSLRRWLKRVLLVDIHRGRA